MHNTAGILETRYFNGRLKGVAVRNSAKTVLHTLYLLKQLPSLDCLPVNDLIYILGKSPMGFFFSVADPDPGFGAFFTPGSGINKMTTFDL